MTAAAVVAFGLGLSNLRQLTSELGRLWLIVGAAWFFFLRAGPLTERLAQRRLGRRARSGAMRGRCVRGRGAGRRDGLTRDMGPLLIAGYGAGAFLAASIAMWWHQRSGHRRSAFSLAVVLFVAGSRSSPRAVRARLGRRGDRRRLENVAAPLRVGQRPARARHVVPARRAARRLRPGCGAVVRLWRRRGGCSGVPAQIQSDYTFTAIVGVFGWIAAWASRSACAFWLHRLIRPTAASRAASPGSSVAGGHGHDGQAFLSWIAVAWVVLALCQLAVTVAGNLAVMPLTGVTFPFVSFGMTSLLVNLAFLALCLNVDPNVAEPRWLSEASADAHAARIRDRREPGRRAGDARHVLLVVAWSGRSTPHAARAIQQRSLRERAPCRRAEDLRGRHRACAVRRADAARCGGAADGNAAVPARMGRAAASTNACCRRCRAVHQPSTLGRSHRRARWPRLDAALRAFSAPERARRAAGRLRRARWFVAAQRALAKPVEVPDESGSAFSPALRGSRRCAGRVDARRRAHARQPGLARHREQQRARALAPRSADGGRRRDVTRRNPWRRLAGCIYLGRTDDPAPAYFVGGSRAARSDRLCALPAMSASSLAGSLRERSPASRGRSTRSTIRAGGCRRRSRRLLQPLEALRQPSATALADGRRRRRRDPPGGPGEPSAARERGRSSTVSRSQAGLSVDITIDPALQALAQKTVACYTGRQDVCRALGIRRAGRRRTAPSARRCSKARWCGWRRSRSSTWRADASRRSRARCRPARARRCDGPGRDAACDRRLPYPVQLPPRCAAESGGVPRRDAGVDDQADHGRGVPVRSGGRRALARRRAHRHGAKRSADRRQPARPADALGLGALSRPHVLPRQGLRPLPPPVGHPGDGASLFGWNVGCREGRADCGKQDLLFGGGIARHRGGRHRTAGTAGGLRAADERAARRQARRSDAPATGSGARSGHPAPLRRRPRWPPPQRRRLGQVPWRGGRRRRRRRVGPGSCARECARRRRHDGDARCGGERAGRSAAPASRRRRARRAVRASAPIAAALRVWRRRRRSRSASRAKLPRSSSSGLSFSHRAGTARTACEQVFDARRCRDIDWLAGKTGTPSFPSDGLSLDELGAAVPAAPAIAPRTCPGNRAACSSLRPYKWYVAAYRDRTPRTRRGRRRSRC